MLYFQRAGRALDRRHHCHKNGGTVSAAWVTLRGFRLSHEPA